MFAGLKKPRTHTRRMADTGGIFPLVLFLILGNAAFSKAYEVKNTRSIRSSNVHDSQMMTWQEFIASEPRGNNLRTNHLAATTGAGVNPFSRTSTFHGRKSSHTGRGWASKMGSALNTAGNVASIGTALSNTILGFKQLAVQREYNRITEARFEREMDMRTNQMCLQICVSDWGPWGGCSVNCGGGIASRTRERFASAVCNGKPCPHKLEETKICNPGCANNGLPSGRGTCTCPTGFSGPCCNNEIVCPFPGKPRHGHLVGSMPARYGQVISYACSDGFALIGNETAIVCGTDGEWSNRIQPECKKIECIEPPIPENGVALNMRKNASLGYYQFGEEVFFRCNTGYILTGPEKRQCIQRSNTDGLNGIWSGFTPLCLPVDCHNPGYPLYGDAVGTEFTLGKRVTFTCKEGFRLVGSPIRTCGANGRWTGHEVRCELISCDEPLIPKHGSIRRSRETYRFGIPIQFQCEEGYTMEGNSTSVCVKDSQLSHLGSGGKWSTTPPICKPTNCGDPGTIENGARTGSVFHYPNNVTFICFNGYILDGASMAHCGYNGVWSAPTPRCLACPMNTFNDGQNECTPCPKNTYTATNASTSERQCLCKLGWTGPPGGPCTEIQCPLLATPVNGTMSCEGDKYNDKCAFKCHVGYILDKGSSRRTCQSTSEWTGRAAQCSACPRNTYKSKERSCLPCPLHSSTIGIASVLDQCTCDEGYEGPAGGPCVDTNECLANDGHGPCDDVCRNMAGSYVCECSIPGWVIKEKVDRHSCKLEKSCRNLTETDAPTDGGLVCHWYLEENSQQCSVKCNNGYEFPARTNNYETCGPTTGYKWTHEERGDMIEPCLEEFMPGFRLASNSSYFVRNCRDLSSDEKEQVKNDFAKMLTDDGVCMRRATKVCDPKNVGIICGATTRRRKRGVWDNVDEINLFFEVVANEMHPSECDNRVCPLLRIPEHRCQALCVTTYKRFLKAFMLYTKRSLKNLFSTQNANFRSAQRFFEYHPGTLEVSDVIVDCPPGMKNNETCVPCSPGTYYSEDDNDCKKCPEHTYQANPQQTRCVKCPLGTYAPDEASYFCKRCPNNKWGEKCQGTCHCEHGQCDSTNGRCLCYSGWEGPECDIDTQSCTAESCHPGVKCHDVPAPGTGFRCDPCPSGFQGDGTICEPTIHHKQQFNMRYRAQRDIMKTSMLYGGHF